MRLTIPTKGITDFDLYRHVGDDDVWVILGEESSYLLELEELHLWLRLVNCKLADKLVDWVWNFRRVHYDLERQHLSIPNDQTPPTVGDECLVQ